MSEREDVPDWVGTAPNPDHPGRRWERWTYLGQNMTGSALWRDAAGVDRGYKSAAGRVFGAYYRALVEREADGGASLYGTPTFAGGHAEDAALIEVRARRVEDRLKLERMEKNTSRMAVVDAALEPLLALVRKMPTPARETFVSYVVQRLWSAR